MRLVIFTILANNSWSDANILAGAHGSIVFDFENDGDDDVFLQSWGGELMAGQWHLRMTPQPLAT